MIDQNDFDVEDTDTDLTHIGMLILQARFGPEVRRIEEIVANRNALKRQKELTLKRSEKSFQ